EADVYILSAFCVENPRLLLNSATLGYPDGLANSSGTLGRYLLAHVAESGMARFPEPSTSGRRRPGRSSPSTTTAPSLVGASWGAGAG
ncbi:MAG: hypothetical protein M3N51_09855, partial [Actinomycetota bacterium]|nr:hypothetical protein [Actinomycetota bacterium]